MRRPFYLNELPKICLSRHPEPCPFIRRAKDPGTKAHFAAYLRRIAALLLRAKDLDDRQGLSRPFPFREPCTACIYTAKYIIFLQKSNYELSPSGRVDFTSETSKRRERIKIVVFISTVFLSSSVNGFLPLTAPLTRGAPLLSFNADSISDISPVWRWNCPKGKP